MPNTKATKAARILAVALTAELPNVDTFLAVAETMACLKMEHICIRELKKLATFSFVAAGVRHWIS